jgi:hypothetical protein
MDNGFEVDEIRQSTGAEDVFGINISGAKKVQECVKTSSVLIIESPFLRRSDFPEFDIFGPTIIAAIYYTWHP